MSLTKEDVFEALRVVEDPELGMDVVDLGLVYEVTVDGAAVSVLYSLTSMGCPGRRADRAGHQGRGGQHGGRRERSRPS